MRITCLEFSFHYSTSGGLIREAEPLGLIWKKESIKEIRQYTLWKVIQKSMKALVAPGNRPEVSVDQHGWQWEEDRDTKQRRVMTNWNRRQNKIHVCIQSQ